MPQLKFIIASVLFLLSCNASAIPISFTHSGTGSGAIGGTVFSDQAFEISASADTDDRTAFGSIFGGVTGYSLDHLSASISIGSLGSFDFLVGTRTFVSLLNSTVGFAHAGSFGGFDLFNGPTSSSLSSWDLVSAIGPLSGSGQLLQWDSFPVNTTGGTLAFTSASTVAQFSATLSAIPEPALPGLLMLGLLLIAITQRQRLCSPG